LVKSIILHFGKNLGCKMWSEIYQKCPLDSRKCVGVWGFQNFAGELTAPPIPISWNGTGVAPLP